MMPKTGFILGKFMPITDGHRFMCHFAQNYSDNLRIMVESHDGQPIDGYLRYEWVKELFPKAEVVHCHEKLPQDPSETPQFWEIWSDVLKRYAPEHTDYVFASEPYGHRVAEILGAEFVPVDIARECRPISATMIRSDPFKHWNMLPEPVRAYYSARVTLLGPESSGKTTLANALGKRFNTVVAPEYGRLFCDVFGMPDAVGLQKIAKGHSAGTKAALRQANRILIEDTDAAMTQIWADMLGSPRDPVVESYWTKPDLYLVCDIDIPWVGDGQRWFPQESDRKRFMELCTDEATRRGVPFAVINGNPDQRVEKAMQAITRQIPAIQPFV